jgi:hypothetical protein
MALPSKHAARTPRTGASQGLLPFRIQEVRTSGSVTSYAGLPLVAEAYGASGAAHAVGLQLHTRPRQRDRGLTDEQMVESFCVLLAGGGECNDDFLALAADAGLSQMLGHALPSPTRAKQFLYAFHAPGH